MEGKEPTKEMLDFPGIEDGIRGMAFIENVVASGDSKEKWTDFRNLAVEKGVTVVYHYKGVACCRSFFLQK